MSRYVCIKDCYYNNKRYAEGEPLEEGVEPNSFFKKTGDTPPAAKAADTDSLSADDVVKLIDEAEESAAKNLAEFKALVGDHLSKFDERIKALETKLAESEAKLNSFVETAGAQVPQGNETPDPESQKNDTPAPAAKSSAKK